MLTVAYDIDVLTRFLFCYKLDDMVCRVFIVDIHPDMKTVIVAELERLLYRPRIAAKAQSVCICIWRLFSVLPYSP